METFPDDMLRELGGQSEFVACAANVVIEWVAERKLLQSKEGLGLNYTRAKQEPLVEDAEGTMLGSSTDNDDAAEDVNGAGVVERNDGSAQFFMGESFRDIDAQTTLSIPVTCGRGSLASRHPFYMLLV